MLGVCTDEAVIPLLGKEYTSIEEVEEDLSALTKNLITIAESTNLSASHHLTSKMPSSPLYVGRVELPSVSGKKVDDQLMAHFSMTGRKLKKK